MRSSPLGKNEAVQFLPDTLTGISLFPMIHSLIATFFFRIPLSWLFSQIDPTSLFWMGFAPPLATLVSLLICFWYMRRRAGRR